MPHNNSGHQNKAKNDFTLSHAVEDNIRKYFRELGDHEATNIHKLVMDEVEKALLSTVLDFYDWNQSKSAKILGINRNTLRKKMLEYGLLDPEKKAKVSD